MPSDDRLVSKASLQYHCFAADTWMQLQHLRLSANYAHVRLDSGQGETEVQTWMKPPWLEMPRQGCRRVMHSFRMHPRAYTSTLHTSQHNEVTGGNTMP